MLTDRSVYSSTMVDLSSIPVDCTQFAAQCFVKAPFDAIERLKIDPKLKPKFSLYQIRSVSAIMLAHFNWTQNLADWDFNIIEILKNTVTRLPLNFFKLLLLTVPNTGQSRA